MQLCLAPVLRRWENQRMLSSFLCVCSENRLKVFVLWSKAGRQKVILHTDDVTAGDCPPGRKMCRGDRKKMCIPRYKFCDGVPDCKHGTDEDPKYCGQFSPHDAVLARYMSWSWGYVRLLACLLQGGVVKMAICTSPGDGQRSCKVLLASGERRRCSN